MALPEERGRDPCSLHWGRSVVGRRLASEALDHCTDRGTGAFWLRLGFWLSAPSCKGWLDVGVRGSLCLSPEGTTPPEVLLLRLAVGRSGKPGIVRLTTLPRFRPVWSSLGAPGAGGCLVPTEKDSKEPSLNPAPLPGAGRDSETGALGAQTLPRGGVSCCTGPTSTDQVEQPARRETPPLAGEGAGGFVSHPIGGRR